MYQVSTNGSLKRCGLLNLSVVLKLSKNGAVVVENLNNLSTNGKTLGQNKC
jgi:hypothetical protein